MKKQSTPWLDGNGNLKSDDEIKNVAKIWGGDDWEHFLSSTVEKPLLEILPEDPGFIENCESNYRQAYQDLLSKSDHPNLQTAIKGLLKDLTTQEQRIIYGTFWEEKSMRAIARELNVTKWTIERYKARALAKLGHLFLENFVLKVNSSKGFKEVSSRFSGQKPIGKEEVSIDQVVGA